MHTLFEAELDACAKKATTERCEEMRGWLYATVLAYLDAQLRGSAIAAAWLDSDNLDAVSGMTASLDSK